MSLEEELKALEPAKEQCDLHYKALGEIAGSAADDYIMAVLSGIDAGKVSENYAVMLRSFSISLMKRGRIKLARKSLSLILDSHHRQETDLFLYASAIYVSGGLWHRDDNLHPVFLLMKNAEKVFRGSFNLFMNISRSCFDMKIGAVDIAVLRDAIDRSLQLNPKSIEAQYFDAMLEQHLGNEALAVSKYEKILASDPDYHSARMRIWLLKGDVGKCPTGDLAPPEAPPASEMEIRPGDDRDPRDAYVKYGSVILKQAIRLPDFDHIVEGMETAWLEEHAEDESGYIRVQSGPEDLREAMNRLVYDSNRIERAIRPIGKWGKDGWVIRPHKNWMAQRHVGDYPKPTIWHQDFPSMGGNSDWFTVWLPFTPCGPGIAPALDVVTCNFGKPLMISEDFTDCINSVSTELAARYFQNSIVQPNFEPGDMLIFDATMLHRTFTQNDLRHKRYSLDVRFQFGPSIHGASGSVSAPWWK